MFDANLTKIVSVAYTLWGPQNGYSQLKIYVLYDHDTYSVAYEIKITGKSCDTPFLNYYIKNVYVKVILKEFYLETPTIASIQYGMQIQLQNLNSCRMTATVQ